MIERAERRYGALGSASHDLAFLATLASHVNAGTTPPPPPVRTAPRHAAVATAYVNHSRWVADCPFCPSAQVVSPADPRFFCPTCENADVGGDYVEVDFPGDVDAIESALNARPNALNRNWTPAEDVAELRADNERHAVDAAAAAVDEPAELVRIVGTDTPRGSTPGLA